MRYCPGCQSVYADESLRFCLQDGSQLLVYPGEISPLPTQSFGEAETVVRQKPITSEWERGSITRSSSMPSGAKNFNPLLIVFMTALGMCVFWGGMAGVWLLLGGSEHKKSSDINNTVNSSSRIKINANTNERTQSNKTDSGSNKVSGWKLIDYQASLNGENLTYYRGTTAEQCQADCAANPKCAGFTLIRAGAYNAGDPPMCYLAAKVTGAVTHACCISGIKK